MISPCFISLMVVQACDPHTSIYKYKQREFKTIFHFFSLVGCCCIYTNEKRQQFLSFYRIEQVGRRLGKSFSISTMVNWWAILRNAIEIVNKERKEKRFVCTTNAVWPRCVDGSNNKKQPNGIINLKVIYYWLVFSEMIIFRLLASTCIFTLFATEG